MKEISDLEIYKLSEELSDIIWHLYDDWDFKAQRTIGLQSIRACDSIAANLAEGYGRYSFPDRKKFYMYARGSFEETKSWLRKAFRRNLIMPQDKENIIKLVQELGPKLNAFIAKTTSEK